MKIFSVGDTINDIGFKVLNERVVRGGSGIMLMLGFIAFVNGFVIKNYGVLPYISGFLALNFAISVFINPKLSPINFIAWLFVRKQTPIYIGAVQKRFAWSLGLILSMAIFLLSMQLLKDVTYFEPVCMLCLICILLLFLETAFAICIGCKLYFLAIRLKLLKAPVVQPNCMGDVCEIK